MFDAQKEIDKTYNNVPRLVDAIHRHYQRDDLEWARLDEVAKDLTRRLRGDGERFPYFSKEALEHAVYDVFHLYARETDTPDGPVKIFQLP